MRAGFLQLRRVGATFRCGARASHCSGFSCCGARALGTWASVVVARRLGSCGSWALECRLSSCDTRAQLLRGMWDLPGPGIKPMSPALAGGFLTTAPPGKSLSPFLYYFKFPASVTSLPFLISLASTLVECMGVFWLLFVFLERNGSRTYKLYSLIFQLINFFLFRFVNQSSILYTSVYTYQSLCPIQHTTITTPLWFSPLGVHTFVLSVCVSTSALQTSSYVPFLQVPDICVNIRDLFLTF